MEGFLEVDGALGWVFEIAEEGVVADAELGLGITTPYLLETARLVATLVMEMGKGHGTALAEKGGLLEHKFFEKDSSRGFPREKDSSRGFPREKY